MIQRHQFANPERRPGTADFWSRPKVGPSRLCCVCGGPWRVRSGGPFSGQAAGSDAWAVLAGARNGIAKLLKGPPQSASERGAPTAL